MMSDPHQVEQTENTVCLWFYQQEHRTELQLVKLFTERVYVCMT